MEKNKLGFWVLTALVVGNMVGSGIFMLPRSLAEVASPGGTILAWVLTGVGVLLIALVFGNLSLRKPDLTGGPQIYAKALFKPGSNAAILSGYLVSWGYWVANFTGNVAIITTFTGYLSTFFPILTSKADLFTIGSYTMHVGNLLTFLICSALLWFLHFVILKGVEGAGKLNLIATAAKIAGFFLFIVVTLFAFEKSNIFPLVTPITDESGHAVSLWGQVNSAAIATLWAFVGVESAVVFSSRARKRSDIKKATITGLLLATFIYLVITVLVMGALSHGKLIKSQKPLVDALESAIGPSGGYILAALAVISLFGATIGWILLSAEVPFQAEKQGLFIKAFGKTNKHGAPATSLIITNLATQLFIFSTISASISSAFDFVIFVATLAFLVPYLISTVYQLKLTLTGETYENQPKSRMIDGIIAALATLYSLWVIKAGTADIKTFLFGVGLLVAGIFFYPLVPKPGKKTNDPVKK
ncbi:amino acid permease [Falsibacillus pallidus]|uniref:amino acid permease n=1 Tax=Falsibacillus pallidus TaxID=493781 RepID=UPI003D9852C3